MTGVTMPGLRHLTFVGPMERGWTSLGFGDPLSSSWDGTHSDPPDGTAPERWLSIFTHRGWAYVWASSLFFGDAPGDADLSYDEPGQVILAAGTIPPALRPSSACMIPMAVYDAAGDSGNNALTWNSQVGTDGSWSLIARSSRPKRPRLIEYGVELWCNGRWPISPVALSTTWEPLTAYVGGAGTWTASDDFAVARALGLARLRGSLTLTADNTTGFTWFNDTFMPFNDVPFEGVPTPGSVLDPVDPRGVRDVVPVGAPNRGQYLPVQSDAGTWYMMHVDRFGGTIGSELFANIPYDALYESGPDTWPLSHQNYRGEAPVRVYPTGTSEPAWLIDDFDGSTGIYYQRKLLDSAGTVAWAGTDALAPTPGYLEGFIYAWQDENNYSAVMWRGAATGTLWDQVLRRCVGGTVTDTVIGGGGPQYATQVAPAAVGQLSPTNTAPCVDIGGNLSSFGGYRDFTQTSIAGSYGYFRADDDVYHVAQLQVGRMPKTGDEYPVPGETINLDGYWWPTIFDPDDTDDTVVTAVPGTVTTGASVSGVLRQAR